MEVYTMCIHCAVIFFSSCVLQLKKCSTNKCWMFYFWWHLLVVQKVRLNNEFTTIMFVRRHNHISDKRHGTRGFCTRARSTWFLSFIRYFYSIPHLCFRSLCVFVCFFSSISHKFYETKRAKCLYVRVHMWARK